MMQFWATPSLDDVYDLLDLELMVEVFPDDYQWIFW